MALIDALLALALLAILPMHWLEPGPGWALSAPTMLFIGVFSAAYLAAAGILRHPPDGRRTNLLRVLTAGICTLGVAFIGLVLIHWILPAESLFDHPNRALAVALSGGLALLVLNYWFPGRHAVTPLIVSAAILGSLALNVHLDAGRANAEKGPERAVSYVDSSLYTLELTSYRGWLPRRIPHGGGLAEIDQRLLVADGAGYLYLVNEAPDEPALSITHLPYRVPINHEEFAAGGRHVFRSEVNQEVEVADFRVAALAVRRRDAVVQIFVSHHFWHTDKQCHVIRVSMLEGTLEALISEGSGLAWRTVFDSQPCLPLNTENFRGPRFEGYENGGRMVFVGDDQMLLTIGDQGFDGVNRSTTLAQDPTTSYGKVLRIELSTGKSEIYSMGHRNPQGLLVDPDGRIWLTEHGPRGGDELNLILEGANFGWPNVTYGTDYSTHAWPLNSSQGMHNGYVRPVFAFVPSIGISSIAYCDSTLFPLWQGDLLVGSLKARELLRLRVREGRVVFAEPIVTGDRIKDFIVLSDGRIVLLSSSSNLTYIRPGGAGSGEALISMCSGCHGIRESDRAILAPNLWEIVNRPVAADSDFSYSSALKKLGGRWTEERLSKFLESPQSFAPGTSMTFPGIPDRDQRDALIQYLKAMPEMN